MKALTKLILVSYKKVCWLDYCYINEKLKADCNKFKQKTETRCWSKSNSTSHYYEKSNK